jgi:hypothetical protein
MGIAIERSDALQNVSVVDIKRLSCYNNLLALELRARWQLLVDDFVELVCGLVR